MSLFQGDSKNAAYGLALLRVVTGLIVLQAGYSKVFMAGFAGAIEGFQGMGIILPQVTAPFVSVLELVGGGALVLGIWPRYLGGIFAIEFAVAAFAQAVLMSKGWGGARLEVLLVVIGLMLFSNGGGAFSLGQLLKKGN